MIKKISSRRLSILLATATFLLLTFATASAQSKDTPLTSQELVKLVYQLPKQPEKKEEVIGEIRRRGLGFPLTDGMRSLVASKSGNDPVLRRTIEEAERRRVNPTASALPSETETRELLEKTRTATRAATEAMPDFVVKQLVTRSYSRNDTNNWLFLDRLSVAVSYRATEGEDYKLLAINGVPPNKETQNAANFAEQVGGAVSAGEYATTLAETLDEEHRATFKVMDTDVLRGRRTVVYEYQMKQEFSNYDVKIDKAIARVGYHGRMWIDRELNRVLRFELIAEMPADFPARGVTNVVDYDWVVIADQRYLLPAKADAILAYTQDAEKLARRNLINFRGYQKYGSEVKILEEDIIEDPPEQKP